jgi:hypothetical protein
MKSFIITLVLLLSATAQAESWRYVDTIDLGVQVFVDTDSIQSAEHWSNRKATLATAYPKGEAVLVPVEVNCQHRTLKTGQTWYSTNPTKHGGKLVKLICAYTL